MTIPSHEINTTNAPANVTASGPSDKELNFRKLESKYEQLLSQERAAREQAERLAQDALARKQQSIPEDDEDDPNETYVDKKSLTKKLNRFGEQTKQQTQAEIRQAVNQALADERRQNWIKQNPDFYDILNQHGDKLYEADRELAETILEMPESFERQKLAYKNIKALGLHKPPEAPKATIQQKVDQNRQSPYYQPSGVGSAPYAMQGDFSSTGQKAAFDKMKALQKTMRI